jgi:vacuolar iron transporter family protein
MASSAPARAAASVRSRVFSRTPVRTTRHRDVQGNAPRAALLGAGDGLITNVSLILGIAGASTNGSTVRLVGIAGLLAGAFSMAAGELVSVRAQSELVAHEIAVERAELADEPEAEQHELAMMYQARGVPPADAATVARILSANHELALDTHTRLELGIDPDAAGSAGRASAASFVSFGVGALLPLLPWFFFASTPAILLTVIIGAVAAFSLGAVTGAFTGRSLLRTGGRQLAVAIVAAGVTYGVGALLGVQTG